MKEEQYQPPDFRSGNGGDADECVGSRIALIGS